VLFRSRGPGAVQYGSAALAGVINIITKRGGSKPKVKLEAGLGSWGESKYVASGSGSHGKIDFAGAASHRTRDDFHTPDGAVAANTDLTGRTSYFANLGYSFDERNRLGLVYIGSVTDDAGKGLADDRSTYIRARQDRRSYAADLKYEGANASGTLSWLARYFHGKTSYEQSRFYFNAAYYGRQTNASSENKFDGAQAQISWKSGIFSIVTGVDWLKYDYQQHQQITNMSEAYSTISNLGGFLLGKLYLLDNKNLVLQAGLRYDTYDVEVKSALLRAGGVRRHVTTSPDSLNPSVGVTYNPTDFLKLRASYGTAYRLPLPRQYGGNTYMGMSNFVGNPELQPEESRNYELGFDIDYKGLFFTATYYNSNFKNKIDTREVRRGVSPDFDQSYAASATAAYYMLWINRDKATIRGLDLGLSFDIGEFFDLDFRLEPYFYWTRLFRFHDDNTGEQLQDMGRDTASFGVDFSYPAYKLSASLDGTRLGNMQSGTGTTARHLQESTVFDFTLRKALFETEAYGDVYIKTTIKNIFNEDYMTTNEEVMPGRSFYVALEYNF
jgi:vitamin B12 transporter